ncbi:MAG: YiiX/YebB-like N1pC/P60 family cysteine hydrolase, partial [Bacteroidales bacterium]|nr:YiiX/YebB-like N1pC/P60 family cysteine hydrolase [Bacteroidales bacterium]
MKTKTKIFIILVIVAVIATTFYILDFTKVFNRIKYQKDLGTFLSSFTLKPGDLVYRRGKSFESFAVLMADRQGEYSHVGLVVEKEGRPFIIHAVPGEEKGKNEVVRCEEPLEFLDFSKATEYAVYRPVTLTGKKLRKVNGYALQTFEDKCIFDHDYDLLTYDKLYCSELIWKAFLEAGLNLVPDEPDNIKVLFTEVKIIMPSTLVKNNHF